MGHSGWSIAVAVLAKPISREAQPNTDEQPPLPPPLLLLLLLLLLPSSSSSPSTDPPAAAAAAGVAMAAAAGDGVVSTTISSVTYACAAWLQRLTVLTVPLAEGSTLRCAFRSARNPLSNSETLPTTMSGTPVSAHDRKDVGFCRV